MPISLKQMAQGYFDSAELFQHNIERLQDKLDLAERKGLNASVADYRYRINQLEAHRQALLDDGETTLNYYAEQLRKQKYCMNCYHCKFKNGTYRCLALNRNVGEDGTCEKWTEEEK